MRRIILSPVACPVVQYFSHYLINCTTFVEKKIVIEHKMCVFTFPTNLSKIYIVVTIIKRDIIINVCRYFCKVTVVLVRI